MDWNSLLRGTQHQTTSVEITEGERERGEEQVGVRDGRGKLVNGQ